MTMDWEGGVWQRHARAGDPPDHRVVVAGDWLPRRRMEQLAIEDPAGLYNDLLAPLDDADLRIVNLEGPLSDRGAPIAKDGPSFRIPPAAVAGLSEISFDLACLANNHVMDHGVQALEDTLEVLGGRGIGSVGAGLTPEGARDAAILETRGLRLGVVNFCEGEDGTAATLGPGTFGWEPDQVVRSVVGLRRDVDVVMVIAHVGREYVPAPPPYVQRLFRSIAAAGADIIVGHHPHVPQGVEIHHGVPIVYSLGNFILHHRRGSLLRRRGLLVSVEITAGTVSGLRLIPCAIDEAGVHAVAPAERSWLFDQLRIVSGLLRDPEQVHEVWYAFIDRFGEEFWRRKVGRTQSIRTLLTSRLGLSRGDRDQVGPATRMRNRFITPAHHHFLADGLDRLGSGALGTAAPWAREIVESWFDPRHPPAVESASFPQ